MSALLDRPFAIAVPEINVPIGVPLMKHRHADMTAHTTPQSEEMRRANHTGYFGRAVVNKRYVSGGESHEGQDTQSLEGQDTEC
jgi:hypothetical protein